MPNLPYNRISSRLTSKIRLIFYSDSVIMYQDMLLPIIRYFLFDLFEINSNSYSIELLYLYDKRNHLTI